MKTQFLASPQVTTPSATDHQTTPVTIWAATPRPASRPEPGPHCDQRHHAARFLAALRDAEFEPWPRGGLNE